MPLHFEPNVGQASAALDYVARGAGYGVGLSARGAFLRLPPSRPDAEPAELALAVVGGKLKPRLRAQQATGVSNYFLGNDRSKWRGNIAHYAAVRFEQVYPGIDWLFHGDSQQLEYDLIVAPGADPRQITLSFIGADRLSIEPSGDLLIRVRGRSLRQRRPVIYQRTDTGEQRLVAGGFILDGQKIGFAVGAYDPARELIIDPTLVYSTYLGGSGGDGVNAIAVDRNGNLYVAGSTFSDDFPTVNPLQASSKGSEATFIAKFNTSGTALVYSTYLGGGALQLTAGLAVDGSGSAYVAGFTDASDFPTVNAFQASKPQGGATFVAKLNAAGNALEYSTYLAGTPGGDQAFAIAVDAAGNAYVAGAAASSNFPTTAGAYKTSTGSPTGFLTKLSAAGNTLVYSTFIGGSGGSDSVVSVAVDAAGEAFITGTTNSADFPTVNALQPANHAHGLDGFVSRFSADGSSLLYSTYLGGSQQTVPKAIAVDGAGNAYAAGNTTCTDFPLANAFQTTNRAGAGGTAFVTALSPGGSALIFSTYLGGSDEESANAIAVSGSGNVFVAGETSSTDFPTANPLQGSNKGSALHASNAFISKLSTTGTVLASTYLGGSGSPSQNFGLFDTGPQGDVAFGLAVDAMDSVYVAGATSSSDFPLTSPLQSQRASATESTGFVSKITLDSQPSGGAGSGSGGGGGGAIGWELVAVQLLCLLARWRALRVADVRQ